MADGDLTINLAIFGVLPSPLCALLKLARLTDSEIKIDFDSAIYRGITWLENHTNEWGVDNLGEDWELPIYTISIVTQAIFGEKKYRKETLNSIKHATNLLAESQNIDGGWDAKLWGSGHWPVRVWSEVGATSNAIQTLAVVNQSKFRKQILKGLEWLILTQNENGSWNFGSCRPELPSFKVSGHEVITKTCDAIKGLLVAIDDETFSKYKPSIELAMDWLRRQEKLYLDENHNIRGWGWVSDPNNQGINIYSTIDYENTAMTLETLVQIPNAPLPLLSANSEWLIRTQYKQDGDLEDGNWKVGHTARITLALIKYYKIIKSSTLYSV